ncbi:MAG: hypothetical protein DRJ38_06660 [Thermoprotei archaeon]|nr:MAG: hypothetical protein DRJ38_06660 [Thermoprotei archaeon]
MKPRNQAVEEIRRIIEEMNKNVDVVIVEGVHDESVLRSLGYRGEILKFSSFRGVLSISDFLEREFSRKSVLILTDYDRRGEMINKRIKKALESSYVKIEERLRKELKILLLKYSMKTIEEAREFVNYSEFL